jgi:DNA processing protein
MTQTEKALRSWLALTHTPKLGPVRIHSLLEIFDNPSVILDAGRSGWKQAGLSEKMIEHLSAPDWDKVDADLKWLDQENASILTLDDDRYPPLLKNIPDAPPVLYILGHAEVLKQPQLAIVGSRFWAMLRYLNSLNWLLSVVVTLLMQVKILRMILPFI